MLVRFPLVRTLNLVWMDAPDHAGQTIHRSLQNFSVVWYHPCFRGHQHSALRAYSRVTPLIAARQLSSHRGKALHRRS